MTPPLSPVKDFEYIINTLWLVLATSLVFLMHLGFACVETGLVRSKNTASILFKNTVIPALTILIFSAWGFQLMYPGVWFQGMVIGFGGFGLQTEDRILPLHQSYYSHFLFQSMLASVSATIVLGAIAERIKLIPFLIFIIFFIGLIFPLIGMWTWGGGWLSNGLAIPFHDFGGASVVHSVGGYAALTGASMLGPRAGKYINDKILPLPGHNMPVAIIGVFLLWVGWIGFNGGAVPATNPDLLVSVLLITMLAGASGAAGAFLTSFFINKKHDITMLVNGILSGLVSITAGADVMSPIEACVIGLIAGILVVFAVLIFDKVKIDDPVGAISVHLICGIWGTISVGLFGRLAEEQGTRQLITQLIGCAAIGPCVVCLSYVVFFILRKFAGLKLSSREESEGLDITEHGMHAYSFDIEK